MLAPRRPKDLSASALTEDVLRDNIISESEAHSERFKRAVGQNPTIRYDVENDDGTNRTAQLRGQRGDEGLTLGELAAVPRWSLWMVGVEPAGDPRFQNST